MKFYTSVLPHKGRLLVRGIDHDGSHKKFKVNYKPSLFTPVQEETGYKTLDGRNVAKIEHESMFEARKWVDEYKGVRKSIIVFGCGNFVNDRDDVKYFKCSTERDLVVKFTKFWTAYNPDIVTGWNVKFFDIPYLMNRFR